jgi:hypothetical protein
VAFSFAITADGRITAINLIADPAAIAEVGVRYS